MMQKVRGIPSRRARLGKLALVAVALSTAYGLSGADPHLFIKLIDSIAWPTAVLAMVWILRERIDSLTEALQKKIKEAQEISGTVGVGGVSAGLMLKALNRVVEQAAESGEAAMEINEQYLASLTERSERLADVLASKLPPGRYIDGDPATRIRRASTYLRASDAIGDRLYDDLELIAELLSERGDSPNPTTDGTIAALIDASLMSLR